MIILCYTSLLIQMAYQLRLTHSSRRSQQDIGLIMNTSDQFFSFFYPITEILVRNNTIYDERIDHNKFFLQI